jgi:hypothetical protein
MKNVVYSVASLFLVLAIIGQIRTGATFPIAKFRTSEPRAFFNDAPGLMR